MPLPADDAPWPPPPLRKHLDKVTEHAAWWSGDAEQIERQYGAETAGARYSRPSQHAGGLVGFAARMFWGRPAPVNEPSTKLHVPLPGDVATAYGNLMFGEPIKMRSEHKATSEHLDTLLDEGMHARLIEAAETVGALGGGWIRPVHDPDVADRPWFDTVPPDAALPEWRGGRPVAVNLWSVVATTGSDSRQHLVWRHVERHEPGRIVHRLYQGTREKIGRPVPLQDVEATAPLAAQVDEDGGIETGWPGLSCVYVPRARPNVAWRADPLLAPMGRSLFAGCEPLFDALDETYSALMRDVRLAKGRVIVGDGLLEDHGRGRGASFDPEREVFYATSGMAKDVPITLVQFDIRVEKLSAAADKLVDTILRRCGLNGTTLGESGEGDGPAMTAREVLTKERRSMLTREGGIRYWTPELGNLAGATLALSRRAFKRSELQPLAPIVVEFPDTVTEDPTTLAGTAEALFRGQSASARARVEVVNPGRDEAWLDKEAERVLDEFAAAGPVIDAPFPGDGRGDESTDGDLDEAAA